MKFWNRQVLNKTSIQKQKSQNSIKQMFIAILAKLEIFPVKFNRTANKKITLFEILV